MPVKKAASKRRKKTTPRKKISGKKAPVRRKVAKKKVAKKKAVSRRKAPARKKVAKKKVAKKKAGSKKRPARKKAVSRKKKTTKKAVSRKRPAKKKAVSRKKPASKKKVPSRRRTPARKPAARKTPARRAKPRGDVLSGPIHGIAPYRPRRREEYMSDSQVEHFRKILSAWKRELIFEVDRTVHHMQDEAANFPDPNDRATQESEFGLELRTRDRERKLLRKIDSALARLDDGSYGFCDETGEEIGLKRLEARPVATLCLEAQERRELAERQFRDRDDRYR